MSDKIEKILNSIKGIKPAEVKPYFYTRLSTKLDTIQNNEAFYLKYERPFLIMLVAVMMALNLFFITKPITIKTIIPNMGRYMSGVNKISKKLGSF